MSTNWDTERRCVVCGKVFFHWRWRRITCSERCLRDLKYIQQSARITRGKEAM